jgi:hypothetical protein
MGDADGADDGRREAVIDSGAGDSNGGIAEQKDIEWV